MIARSVVLAFGWIVIGIGGWVILDPRGLVDLADVFLQPGRLWIVVALRLGIGVLLWIAAPASRMPRTLKVLAVLIFVSGLVVPVVGLESIREIADWGAGLQPLALRVVGMITAAFGAFIVWSLWPGRREG